MELNSTASPIEDELVREAGAGRRLRLITGIGTVTAATEIEAVDLSNYYNELAGPDQYPCGD